MKASRLTASISLPSSSLTCTVKPPLREKLRSELTTVPSSVAVSTVLSAFVALSLTPALCALMLKPKDKNQRPGLAGRFFGGFNRVFERLTDSYGRKVQTLIRRSLLSLLMLGILIFAAFGLMNKVPGGFVPSEDQGYFLGSVQLPAAASLNRTEIVTTKVDAILKSHEAVDKRLIINGYNILNGAPQSDSGWAAFVIASARRRVKEYLLGEGKPAASVEVMDLLQLHPRRERKVKEFNPGLALYFAASGPHRRH